MEGGREQDSASPGRGQDSLASSPCSPAFSPAAADPPSDPQPPNPGFAPPVDVVAESPAMPIGGTSEGSPGQPSPGRGSGTGELSPQHQRQLDDLIERCVQYQGTIQQQEVRIKEMQNESNMNEGTRQKLGVNLAEVKAELAEAQRHQSAEVFAQKEEVAALRKQVEVLEREKEEQSRRAHSYYMQLQQLQQQLQTPPQLPGHPRTRSPSAERRPPPQTQQNWSPEANRERGRPRTQSARVQQRPSSTTGSQGSSCTTERNQALVHRMLRALSPAPTLEQTGQIVDSMVKELKQILQQRGTELPLKKVGPCVYCLGRGSTSKKVNLTVNSNRLMVKVGGGNEDFLSYLLKWQRVDPQRGSRR